ncbi:hypothetical protein [Pygmaiobacter massiliensis]|uniref:hypothetical protein n=1 Tax=Pygmaiobacter massiliensis TaxID=1917873 RepID=UPI002A82CD8A|nr:hypothetical protein [Pygmaiobacter massiliensis]MDY4785241.1 hypothetical protein [Pygmaiobacter massiliensis]
MTELDKRELVELIRGVVNPGFESVNQRIDGLEQRMGGMERRMDGMEQRMGGMAGDIRKLQLDNENVIKPQIQKIAEGHMQLAEKMDRMQDELSAVHEEVTAVSLAFGYHQQQAQGYQR